MVIGGDSAGGGLCLALMQKLRDANIEMPIGSFLISPWTDLTFSGETIKQKQM
ncbi:MAG: alpha/beta hydrolase fold domain-containing protein [Bacteroidetes bacterium]|nr:alpha/beta hydrolase fold domain-containing protein [Bacteroidota bacterium]